ATFCHGELAEAGEVHLASPLEDIGDGVKDRIDGLARLLLVSDSRIACEHVEKLSLGHVFLLAIGVRGEPNNDSCGENCRLRHGFTIRSRPQVAASSDRGQERPHYTTARGHEPLAHDGATWWPLSAADRHLRHQHRCGPDGPSEGNPAAL